MNEQKHNDTDKEPQLNIVSVKNLLEKKFSIPFFQRPYRWKIKSVQTLLDDIFQFSKPIEENHRLEYRLGTVIFYQSNDNLEIIDGQQRIITLILILKCLENNGLIHEEKLKMPLDLSINDKLSKETIITNYLFIQNWIKENKITNERISFLLNNCKLVTFIVFQLYLSFQLFDCQNTRGKELKPHDLLKSFHFREIKFREKINDDENKNEKENKNYLTKIDKIWRQFTSDFLHNVFELLFRIRMWSKMEEVYFFTKDNLDEFKGFKPLDKSEANYFKTIENLNSHEKIYRIADLKCKSYTKVCDFDEFDSSACNCGDNSSNKDYESDIKLSYPMQIDQTIINGSRFFHMIFYYASMIKKYDEDPKNIIYKDKKLDSAKEKEIDEIYETINVSNKTHRYRDGDSYLGYIFKAAVIYCIDRFGIDENLSKNIRNIFLWAFKKRIEYGSISKKTCFRAAASNHEMFSTIKACKNHIELINSYPLTSLKPTEFKGSNKSQIIEKKFIEIFESYMKPFKDSVND